MVRTQSLSWWYDVTCGVMVSDTDLMIHVCQANLTWYSVSTALVYLSMVVSGMAT